MFRIDLLPARRGDSIWIEYGDTAAPHRVLIDGGLVSTCREHLRPRIEALPESQRRFDLLVITHVDLDHIAGILELFRDPPKGLSFDDVWFNAYNHLIEDPAHILGPLQGESVSALIQSNGYTWNAAFGGNAVQIADSGNLPTKTLVGGMTLTLLSPTRKRLQDLEKVWKEEVLKAGLEPGTAGWQIEGLPGHPEDREDVDPGVLGSDEDIEKLANSMFSGDKSQANGSSIAFLAEFDGKTALFTGDAISSDLEAALKRLFSERKQGNEILELDALKISHHGGRKNTSPKLLQLLKCKRFLISTDGSIYRHPHKESIARVLVHAVRNGKPDVLFNYGTDGTKYWDDVKMYDGRYPYQPSYPPAEGISVAL